MDLERAVLSVACALFREPITVKHGERDEQIAPLTPRSHRTPTSPSKNFKSRSANVVISSRWEVIPSSSLIRRMSPDLLARRPVQSFPVASPPGRESPRWRTTPASPGSQGRGSDQLSPPSAPLRERALRTVFWRNDHQDSPVQQCHKLVFIALRPWRGRGGCGSCVPCRPRR